jgi:hypothetical protein
MSQPDHLGPEAQLDQHSKSWRSGEKKMRSYKKAGNHPVCRWAFDMNHRCTHRNGGVSVNLFQKSLERILIRSVYVYMQNCIGLCIFGTAKWKRSVLTVLAVAPLLLSGCAHADSTKNHVRSANPAMYSYNPGTRDFEAQWPFGPADYH